MKAADKSGDGKIQKPELYEIFKKVLSWLDQILNTYIYY
jgi:hypothetical protein